MTRLCLDMETQPHQSWSRTSYLAAVRIEQLEARVLPSQADPFFTLDLAAVAAHIESRVNKNDVSPSQLFILTRDQAFFKTLFFTGDKAGDLGRVKTLELLYFPRKEGLLFNQSRPCAMALPTYFL